MRMTKEAAREIAGVSVLASWSIAGLIAMVAPAAATAVFVIAAGTIFAAVLGWTFYHALLILIPAEERENGVVTAERGSSRVAPIPPPE